MKRSHEACDDAIEHRPRELCCPWIARITRVATKVQHERGRSDGRDPDARSFEIRERLDEEMPKFGPVVIRCNVEPSLSSIRGNMCCEPIARRHI